MLDPLTALSVASSIIQIVDFGGRLFALTTRTVRADGVIEGNVDLELIATDLCAAVERLEKASRLKSQSSPTKPLTLAEELAARRNGAYRTSHSQPTKPADQQTPDDRLCSLASRSHDISTRLLKILEEIKSKGEGKFRTWNAIRQSLHSMMKRDEIDEYLKRLEPLRGELMLNLVEIMRNEQSDLHIWLHDIMLTSSQAQIDNVDQLRLMKAEIMDLAEMHRRTIAANRAVDLSAKSEAILQSVLATLQKVGEKGDDSTRCQRIVSSLTFKEMPMRHVQIPETYANTFAWMLEDYPFRPWLEGSGGTFWIDGKPGSGKSTMMKMLSNSPRTREILRTWSVSNKLVISSTFFWSSGYPMQRSQLGFLQSLLYQVLRHFPEQVPTLCPRRWRKASQPEEFDPWTKSELVEILTSITANQDLAARYCFFIDGLDECGGEHYELVQMLARIGQPSAVKICVSSRPWNVFRKAFGHAPERRLILQDLTTNDMDRYIRDKLEADDHFAESSGYTHERCFFAGTDAPSRR